MAPTTISFDCYGTLVDWEGGISAAFQKAASQDGINLQRPAIIAAYHEVEPQIQATDYRPYREVLGEAATLVASRLGWELNPDRAGFLAESLPDWPVFADTGAALGRLKSRFSIAILSNIDDDLLQATIDRIGVEFDWTITAQQIRSYKPAHPHFQEGLRRAGGQGNLLHAAQSYFHDIRPAAELGIPAVWVNRKNEPAGDGGDPLRMVTDLTDLADWLLQ
jgi:2-haloalkanoic acid dehalogenase type II